MSPTSVVAFVLFVLVVLPGLLHEGFRSVRRAGRHDSAFVEVSRIVVAGVFVGLLATGLYGLLRLPAADVLADPRSALIDERYVPDNLLLVAWSLGVYLVLASACALISAQAAPSMSGGRIAGHSAWVQMHARRPVSSEPLAWIRLDDGTEWSGRLWEFSTNQELADRELLLGPPLTVRFPDGSMRDTSHYDRVVLRGDGIQHFAVRWRATDASPPTLSRWKRSSTGLQGWVTSPKRAVIASLLAVSLVALGVGIAAFASG